VAAGAAVKGVGGKKGRSGRKSKAEEMGLTSLLKSAFTLKDRKDVIQNLLRIARGQDDKAAVSAASLLLGYAFGKPTEKHEHSGQNGEPITVRVVYDDKK
jgi:hypothetical protein